jgi:chemotaxis protein MotB
MKRVAAFLLAASMFGGCISIATHEAQMKKCREVAEHARQTDEALSTAQTKNKELQSMLDDQQQEQQALQTELTQVRGTYDELIQELKDDIAKGGVSVRETAQGLIITLDNQILFRSGQSQLQAQGKRVLKQVASVLQHVQGHQIQVQGHTDNVRISGALKARFPSNWELSAARAGSVLRFLQDVGKVDPSLLVLQAYADQKPVGDNSTPAGRRQNRRVDIVLVPVPQQ